MVHETKPRRPNVRLVEIVKAQRSEKQYTDSQLRNLRNVNAVFAAGNVAGAGYGGYRAVNHALKVKEGREIQHGLRTKVRPDTPQFLRDRAANLDRQMGPRIKGHKKDALIFGGLAGASTGVAGLNTWRARKAQRELRERA
jgi:hypothetical protein